MRKIGSSPALGLLSFLLVSIAAACSSGESFPRELDMTTWSVVGVDPETGDVGVAVASCVPTHGDAVAALVPGMGAAATQAGFNVDNRNRVFEAVQEGLTAEEVILRVTDPSWDDELERRQYGVVTMHDGLVNVAGYTTPLRQGTSTDNDGSTRYAGVMADASHGVSSQGNTLESSEVVSAPLDAYRWDDPAGFNWLSDRLMRALEAGSVAGGDVRCNDDSIRQTASMAVILVARGQDAPYATESIGMTDAGTPNAPWLAISVATERMAENPLLELRRQYDEWRRTASIDG
ncbi:MAG TPA: hypothetical protein DHW11_02510 [Gemmatimonadetes bacterium]|nr:hypothetical protein [Gemmatimonadota bacterium]|tara:strand:+ start:1834 stop:2706 length:873 start_codon:yes stop_codon:yes gene_type:complete